MHEIPAVFVHRFLERTIWNAASDAPTFSTMVDLADKVGLVDIADGDGPNTIFLPNNAAFEELSNKINLNDTVLVKQIFEYHVIPGTTIYAQSVMPGDALVTLQGEPLTITMSGVNNASIITANMVMANGVVHTIQEVLIPPSIQAKIDDGSITNTTPPMSSGPSGTLDLGFVLVPLIWTATLVTTL